jgi:hypothetical protein
MSSYRGYGNVTEDYSEIMDQIDRLLGQEASRNNLARRQQRKDLLLTLLALQKHSISMSGGEYLKAMNRLMQAEKEIF